MMGRAEDSKPLQQPVLLCTGNFLLLVRLLFLVYRFDHHLCDLETVGSFANLSHAYFFDMQKCRYIQIGYQPLPSPLPSEFVAMIFSLAEFLTASAL